MAGVRRVAAGGRSAATARRAARRRFGGRSGGGRAAGCLEAGKQAVRLGGRRQRVGSWASGRRAASAGARRARAPPLRLRLSTGSRERQVLSGGVAEVLRRERESVAEVLRRGDAPVAPAGGAHGHIPTLATYAATLPSILGRKVKSSVGGKCSGEVSDGSSDLPSTYANYPEQLSAGSPLHNFPSDLKPRDAARGMTAVSGRGRIHLDSTRTRDRHNGVPGRPIAALGTSVGFTLFRVIFGETG